MLRRFSLWNHSDLWATRLLRLRGRILIASGHVMRDEFLKLAGRFDLWEAQRRPVPGANLRR
jgi:hypothetical protein